MKNWDEPNTEDVPTIKSWDDTAESTPTMKSWDEPAAPKTVEKPGWFQPGSKSEALVRGVSQGATLGFGDEIQAILRSLGSDETYSDLRDSERAANQRASKQNPGTYMAGELSSSLPLFAATAGGGLAAQTAKTAAMSGAAGLGGSQGSLQDQALDTAKSAAIGGAIPVVGAGVGKVVKGVAKGVEDLYGSGVMPGAKTFNTLKDALPNSADKQAQQKFMEAVQSTDPAAVAAAKSQWDDLIFKKNTLRIPETLTETGTNAVTGAATAAFMGQDPLTGAIGGALIGPRFGNSREAIHKTAKVLGPVAANAINNRYTRASAAALLNMSGNDARQIKQKYEPKIQEAIDKGQPAYAATFQAMSSSPELRAAQANDLLDDDENDTEE